MNFNGQKLKKGHMIRKKVWNANCIFTVDKVILDKETSEQMNRPIWEVSGILRNIASNKRGSPYSVCIDPIDTYGWESA